MIMWLTVLKILMNLQKKTLLYQQKYWYKNLNRLKGKDTLWYDMIAPQYQAIVTL